MRVQLGSGEGYFPADFFLTDQAGNFYHHAIPGWYAGFFVDVGGMTRILESMSISDFAATELEWQGNRAHLMQMREALAIWLPYQKSMVFAISRRKTIRPILDIKRAYDNRTWGRVYKIKAVPDGVVIRFTKNYDPREDAKSGAEWTINVAIVSNGSFVAKPSWQKADYSSAERFRYVPGEFMATTVSIAATEDEQSALRLARTSLRTVPPKTKIVSSALDAAKESLSQLTVNQEHMYAGLPWFFQHWTRDTAVSLKSLARTGHGKLVKTWVHSLLNELHIDGRMPNVVAHDALGSADGTGWLFYRCDQLSALWSDEEKDLISKLLALSVRATLNNYVLDNLVINSPQETWMDSTGKTPDTRSGYRIEIQALFLAILNYGWRLTGDREYPKMELSVKSKVHQHFWNGRVLADGKDDWTVRPNIFIAAYVYPKLLTPKEWSVCFETALKELWLGWGGLASIAKSHSLFVDTHTEDDRSYHRGDSWYWINNLAAIVMHRCDSKRFARYVDRIARASTEEIIHSGAIGAHAEISSAKQRESRGCTNQAWSNAMYIELMEELNNSTK